MVPEEPSVFPAITLTWATEAAGEKATYSKGTRTPWASTPDLAQVAQDREGGLVAQGHIDDAVVGHGAHGRDGGAFLSAAHGRGADEDAGVFAPVGAAGPLRAGVVPEGLPLGGEVAVARGDAEEEGVVLFERDGVDDWDRGVLGWGVHFGEDIFGEGFGHPGRGRGRVSLFGSWVACVRG